MMADVQEGFVKIPNPVMEALALAPFNRSQVQVLLAIIRLTWGWRRTDVQVSSKRLADATGLARSSAAAALRELVADGVVLELQKPSSRGGVYQPQKDPTTWGRFAVTPPTLSGTPDTSDPQTLRPAGQKAPASRTEGSGQPDTPAPEVIGAQQKPAAERQVGKDREKTERPSAKKKKAPLPDGWAPNDTHRRIAAEERVDLDREAVNFRDHAEATGRTMIDWDAAFRTWLRRAADFSGRREARGNGGPQNGQGRLSAAEEQARYERHREQARRRERLPVDLDQDVHRWILNHQREAVELFEELEAGEELKKLARQDSAAAERWVRRTFEARARAAMDRDGAARGERVPA